MSRWPQDAVVYQVYPRSFQDSEGDGFGDLPGLTARLEHIARLGCDAVWLSPIYPSPGADLGYDVSDYTDVDPLFGSLGDLDELIAAAHGRDLRVLLDLVVSHTSIEHPWFREHPERYVWADGLEPPNNWVAVFGGPAWSRDPASGRWYLHSFYPEQPDLDWSNPEVVAAIQDVVRFWLKRGVDGFRLDAIDRARKDPQLRDDPPASGPPPFPMHPEAARLAGTHSRNAPEIVEVLAALREAAGEAVLVGEVYLTGDRLAPYLEHLDLAFDFEFLHGAWEAEAMREVVRRSPQGAAWVLSNHDFARVPDRFGPEATRAAAVLLLTLPGCAFVYQGEELGLADGPGGPVAHDRFGRDRHRHPMPWQPGPGGGFTTGEPWLPVAEAPGGTVAEQAGSEGSMLELYRSLIGLRRRLGPGLELLDSAPGTLAYRRGRHVVAINFTAEERPLPAGAGTPVLETHPRPPAGGLPPHGALVAADA